MSKGSKKRSSQKHKEEIRARRNERKRAKAAEKAGRKRRFRDFLRRNPGAQDDIEYGRSDRRLP